MFLRLKREMGPYKDRTRKSAWVRSTTVLLTEVQNISFISTSSISPKKYLHFSFLVMPTPSFQLLLQLWDHHSPTKPGELCAVLKKNKTNQKTEQITTMFYTMDWYHSVISLVT